MTSLRTRLIATELAEHTEGVGRFKTTYLHNNVQAALLAEGAVAAWLHEKAAELRRLAEIAGDPVIGLAADTLTRLAEELQHIDAEATRG